MRLRECASRLLCNNDTLPPKTAHHMPLDMRSHLEGLVGHLFAQFCFACTFGGRVVAHHLASLRPLQRSGDGSTLLNTRPRKYDAIAMSPLMVSGLRSYRMRAVNVGSSVHNAQHAGTNAPVSNHHGSSHASHHKKRHPDGHSHGHKKKVRPPSYWQYHGAKSRNLIALCNFWSALFCI